MEITALAAEAAATQTAAEEPEMRTAEKVIPPVALIEGKP
jgi:hypothetical protein